MKAVQCRHEKSVDSPTPQEEMRCKCLVTLVTGPLPQSTADALHMSGAWHATRHAGSIASLMDVTT